MYTYERPALLCIAISLLQDEADFQNSSQGVKENQFKYKNPPAIFRHVHIIHLCQLVLADTKHTNVTARWYELCMTSDGSEIFFLFETPVRER